MNFILCSALLGLIVYGIFTNFLNFLVGAAFFAVFCYIFPWWLLPFAFIACISTVFMDPIWPS